MNSLDVGTLAQRVRYSHRSRLYASLHSDEQIAARTRFFFAAALITDVFAWGCAAGRGSSFWSELSDRLEAANVTRAHQIRAHQIYRYGSISSNTADFVHYEQTLVQQALDRLRVSSPMAYLHEVDASNRWLHGAWFQFAAQWARPDFLRSLRAVSRELGRPFDIASQGDRECLGRETARDCR